jgi:hypothetical protein
MARERSVEICALNLSANPHPAGVYLAILRRAARYLVQARGTDYAKITAPRSAGRDGIYTGRIPSQTSSARADLRGASLLEAFSLRGPDPEFFPVSCITRSRGFDTCIDHSFGD